MTQHPGDNDPYQHDPNAPRPEQPQGGYQAAPGYDAAPSYDGGGPRGPVAKPGSVGLAEKLTYAGGVLALLGVLVSVFTQGDVVRDTVRQTLENAGQVATPEAVDAAVQLGMITAVITGIISAGLWFLIGFFLGKGKGWARIVATILGALNVVGFLVSLLGSSMMPGASGGALATVVGLISAALAAAIVFLIWKKESTDYFRATP